MGKRRPIWRAIAVVSMLVVISVLALGPASALAEPPAVATTKPATDVTSSSAVLNGSASPTDGSATYYFEYWMASDPVHKSSTPQTTVSSNPVSATITGLLPGTTYSFRLIVSETYQEPPPSTGETLTFTTPATPGTVATTGQATGIKTTSATLNGVTNTIGSVATWYFQWGPTAAYGQMTSPQTVSGPGLNFVSGTITGLKPRTRYHFRLVVLQSNTLPNYGADSSFVTAHPGGHASLLSHRVRVRHGTAAVRFKCSGQRGDPCDGKVSLKARGVVGKHAMTISCGKAVLSTTAPHRHTVKVKLGSRCNRLLGSSKDQQLHAKLRAVFSTHQRRLRAAVTLIKV